MDLKNTSKITNVDDYIASFSIDTQRILKKVKQIVKSEAPTASFAIKYQMPTLILNGNLLHFAAFKNHIGFYPTPSAIIAFKEKLKKYKTSKGAIQFPIDSPIPYDLIRKITRYRVLNTGKDK